MPSDPSGKPFDPAQPSSGKPRQTGSRGSSKPARNDVPDADAAEPVPHEHLPSRSDDN